MSDGITGYYFKNGKSIISKIGNIVEYCDLIIQNYKELQEENRRLWEENKKIKDKKYAKGELAKIQNKYNKLVEDVKGSFRVTKEQNEEIHEWQEQHIINHHNGNQYSGAIGGNWIYEFAPTSIGMFASCYCSSCRAKAEKEYNEKLKEYGTNNNIYTFMDKYDAQYQFQEEF